MLVPYPRDHLTRRLKIIDRMGDRMFSCEGCLAIAVVTMRVLEHYIELRHWGKIDQ